MAEGAIEEGDFSSPLPPLARIVPLNVRTINEIHTKETASYAGRRDRLFNFLWVFTHVCAQQLQGFIKQTLIAAEIPATSEQTPKMRMMMATANFAS